MMLTSSLMLALVSTQQATASIGTKQVDVTRRGGDPTRSSANPSISADGRYVAFSSLASDLVDGDRNGHEDVFVRDLVLGSTTRVSVDEDGLDANGPSGDAFISPDGRSVAFSSFASDLVANDANHADDVFVRDLLTGTTTRASVDTVGGDPNDSSSDPTVGPGGRFVAFQSEASDLVAGDGNHETDVFVRDLVGGTTIRASVDVDGGDPDGGSSDAWISASGRYVAFGSSATDLVPAPPDHNSRPDVFVRDLVAGTTVRVSVDLDGGDANSDSYQAAMSGDERYVVFASSASDLVDQDHNGVSDVFVRDLALGVTTRVSVGLRGGDASGQSYGPAINGDGRYVVFTSYASNLIPDDGNATSDVFVRDMLEGVTVRASVDLAGGDPNDGSGARSISASGRVAAFESYATDLVPGRGDKWLDVFVARLD